MIQDNCLHTSVYQPPELVGRHLAVLTVARPTARGTWNYHWVYPGMFRVQNQVAKLDKLTMEMIYAQVESLRFVKRQTVAPQSQHR